MRQRQLTLVSALNTSVSWVAERIEFEPHAGFPDPLLALKRRRGDCNEKSAALVVVLHSLGLKAEQVFGLLWLGGAQWGMHAWVRVETPYGWLELDPSMRSLKAQTRIGPEHIAITAGAQRAQSKLALLWGQWRAEVVE